MTDSKRSSRPGRLVLATAVALAGLSAGTMARAETLDEALMSAYLNNPTLQARRAELRATDERVAQALSGWRPTVQIEGDAGIADVRSVSSTGGVSSTIEDTLKPRSGTLSVVQPLYRGGRTVAETSSAENLVDSGRAQLEVTEQRVFLDAATAYMDVLQALSEVDLNRNNEKVVKRQLEAAQDRFDVGEVTRTDVAQAEARLAQAQAERVSAEGSLISARASYRQVVGQLPESLSWPKPATGLPKTESDALQAANRVNPAIVSADYAERSARDDIDVATSSLLPQVSLRAAYDRQYDQTTFTEETESASVAAVLSVPLYQGGAEYSQVRRSKEVAGQRRIEVEEARRSVLEEVTSAWEALMTAQAQITAFESQVHAAEIALDGVEQEALVGLRTTLDVLDAEQELFQAQVNLVRARHDEIVSAYWVKLTIGELTAEKLGLPVKLYDPQEHYDRVRNKWIGLSTE